MSRAGFSRDAYERLLEELEGGVELKAVYEEAREYCRACRVPSPLVCVERCHIWKVNSERLELDKITSRSRHLIDLFNAVKNKTRSCIIRTLLERPLTLKELQRRLRKGGLYHSLGTIASFYIDPLLRVGLVRKEGDRYETTLYGRKIRGILSEACLEDLLLPHSGCHEELCLMALAAGPKTYGALAKYACQGTLRRTLKRLVERGLVSKSKPSDRVFFFIAGEGTSELTPTEKRVFNALSKGGMPARRLSRVVGITLRRTYKYLKRLREKGLIDSRRRETVFGLTPMGEKIANCLKEMRDVYPPTPAPRLAPERLDASSARKGLRRNFKLPKRDSLDGGVR